MAEGREAPRLSTLSGEYVQESSESGSDDERPPSHQPEASKETSRRGDISSSESEETEEPAKPDEAVDTESGESSCGEESDQEENLQPLEVLLNPTAPASGLAKRKAETSSKASQRPVKKVRITESSTPPRRSEAVSKPASQPESTTTPAKPFVPPSGFDLVTTIDDDASDFRALLNTEGVQVWHITAPKGVPLSSIKELDIGAAMQGKPIYKHDGISYSLDSVPIKDFQVFLPRKAKKNTTGILYSKTTVPISRSLQLRELSKSEMKRVAAQKKKDERTDSTDKNTEAVNGESGNSKSPSKRAKAAKGADDSEGREDGEGTDAKPDATIVFTAQETGKSPEPRKQPNGLRMRYIPIGSQAKAGQSDSSRRGQLQFEVNDEHPVNKNAGILSDVDMHDYSETPRSWKKHEIFKVTPATPKSEEKKKKLQNLGDHSSETNGIVRATTPASSQQKDSKPAGDGTPDSEMPPSERKRKQKKSRVDEGII